MAASCVGLMSTAGSVAGAELPRAHAALGAVVRLAVDGVGERPALSLSSGSPQQGEDGSDSFHDFSVVPKVAGLCSHDCPRYAIL